MIIAGLETKMLEYLKGRQSDILHFQRVLAYARQIGEMEGLDPEEMNVVEAAAVVHDIACPYLRETECRHQLELARGEI